MLAWVGTCLVCLCEMKEGNRSARPLVARPLKRPTSKMSESSLTPTSGTHQLPTYLSVQAAMTLCACRSLPSPRPTETQALLPAMCQRIVGQSFSRARFLSAQTASTPSVSGSTEMVPMASRTKASASMCVTSLALKHKAPRMPTIPT